MQVVAFGACHPDGVALNGRLHFDLAALDNLLDLFGLLDFNAVAHLADLLDLVAADFFDLADVQKAGVHTGFGELAAQDVVDLVDLKIAVANRGDFLVLELYRGRGNSVNTEAYLHNTKVSNSDYVVLGDEKGTASKSLLSKAKNLLHTLSTPFRTLIRVELHRQVGQREENLAVFKNIKSTPMPRSTTNERKAEFVNQPAPKYRIVSPAENYEKPLRSHHIWG